MQWLCAPTTYFDGDRPVDYLANGSGPCCRRRGGRAGRLVVKAPPSPFDTEDRDPGHRASCCTASSRRAARPSSSTPAAASRLGSVSSASRSYRSCTPPTPKKPPSPRPCCTTSRCEGGLPALRRLLPQNARPPRGDRETCASPSCTAWDYAASGRPRGRHHQAPLPPMPGHRALGRSRARDRSGRHGVDVAPVQQRQGVRVLRRPVRRDERGFAQDPTHARIFASPADQAWLIDLCAPLHVDVLLNP